MLESPSEEDLAIRGFTYWKSDRVDGSQGWVIGGVLVGLLLSIPSRAPSKMNKVTRS